MPIGCAVMEAVATRMAGRTDGFQFISFLTDFGLDGESVGICKGVIARINPDARVIDITHGVPAFDVTAGALALASTVTYMPVAVHLAVVDPGVGSRRQAVALAVARGDILVGPDNGLLRPAAEALGGILHAYRLENRKYMLQPVSATFHARDVFAPAAAHISRGVDPVELGARVGIEELVPAPWQDHWLPMDEWLPALTGTNRLDRPSLWRWEGTVIGFDQYGSARLNLRLHPEDDPWGRVQKAQVARGERTAQGGPTVQGGRTVQLHLAPVFSSPAVRSPVTLPWVYTYSDVPPGTPCLLVDSDGRLLIAVDQGSARRQLGLATGQRVIIELP